MVKKKYMLISDVDCAQLKCVFEYINETKNLLSIALEPWGSEVQMFQSDCIKIYVPTKSEEQIEFAEYDGRERLIGSSAEPMVVEINGRIIANLPKTFPEFE